ncbi:hypothetical protein D9M69_612240 [compost metagenome]
MEAYLFATLRRPEIEDSTSSTSEPRTKTRRAISLIPRAEITLEKSAMLLLLAKAIAPRIRSDTRGSVARSKSCSANDRKFSSVALSTIFSVSPAVVVPGSTPPTNCHVARFAASSIPASNLAWRSTATVSSIRMKRISGRSRKLLKPIVS